MKNIDIIRANMEKHNARAAEARELIAEEKARVRAERADKARLKRLQKKASAAPKVSDYTALEKKAQNQTNINHYTDAAKYAGEYYGEVYSETTKFDDDWD